MIPGKGKNIKNVSVIEDNALVKIEGRNGQESIIKWSEVKEILNSDLTFLDSLPSTVVESSYAEIPVSSAEILALPSTITLLAEPGAGLYYEIILAVLEYNHVATPYTTAATDYLEIAAGGDNYTCQISVIKSANDQLAIVKSTENVDAANEVVYSQAQSLNLACELTSWDGTSPTLGDGTLLVKIWYNIRTFGTEL